MRPDERLLIVGASARAAAFSALRAGLRPWCADLFADADLAARCPTHLLSTAAYPHGFLDIADKAPCGPWLYTGGLEHYPMLVRRLAARRPLWGNDEHVLRAARSPALLKTILSKAGIPCPDCRLDENVPATGRWLVKPLRGARGAAIRPWQGQLHGREKKRFYLQERIEGDSGAAIYIASASSTLLLGVTRQLVGEEWLHAGPFSYCGSIGPLPLEPSLYSALEQLGMVVAANIGLRGLFGIDFIQRDGIPWPVEINPRYTASVEVLELADGISALSLHRQVFEAFPERHTSPTPAPALCRNPKTDSPGALGKAVLFARAPLVFPDDGHWKSYREECRETRSLWNIPAFADIPPPGRRIEAGGPILTFFAEEESIPECLNRLREMARDLDRRLGND